MYLEKMNYYIQRIKFLGVRGITRKYLFNARRFYFCYQWKQHVTTKQAHHTWHHIKRMHRLSGTFLDFFTSLTIHHDIDRIIHDQRFTSLLPYKFKQPDVPAIIKQAQQACNNQFQLLGSQKTTFHAHNIPWHKDFKLNQLNALGFSRSLHSKLAQNTTHLFYHDIIIPTFREISLDEYAPDIKVPWELSRFQHIFALGKAYHITHEQQPHDAQQYAQAFCQQVQSWITSNPFLLGVNWVCPMDVAIRAINFIWGYYFFKDEPSINESFWKRFVCSLYDHFTYLSFNIEQTDKPNNHLLAELLGYLYLCRFFEKIKHGKKHYAWCKKKLETQFNHQLLPDGTSYEGSTCYHRLITELYLHFMVLTDEQHNNHTAKRFTTMLNVVRHCTDASGTLVQIGDNDSGKLLTGISTQPSNKNITKTYKNFGLTIIKYNNVHITFRHPTYTPHQPTGHMHQDSLALTLSFNKHQFLVDPGTYLYTANPQWRNYFRSFDQHNTFHVNKPCCQILPHDLFQLSKQQHKHTGTVQENDATLSVKDSYEPCVHQPMHLKRCITFDKQKLTLHIQDNIESQEFPLKKNFICSWNLLIHPDITIKTCAHHTWIAQKNNRLLGYIKSDLPFVISDAFHSPSYGIKQPCTKLSTLQTLSSKSSSYTTTIIIIPNTS